MRLGALACMAGCLSAAASTSAAHASSVSTSAVVGDHVLHYMLPGGRTADSGPSPSASDKLIYHGGPVETASTNYAIFWEPDASGGLLRSTEANINTVSTN